VKLATITRKPGTDHGTFGVWRFGPHVVHSLELPWRDNRRGRSCIPPGKYRCAMRRRVSGVMAYEVYGVPGRSNVLIHSANLAGDVDAGLDTHLQGCIAPCLKVGVMRNSKGAMQAAGLVSKPAVRLLEEWAGGEPFELEIT